MATNVVLPSARPMSFGRVAHSYCEEIRAECLRYLRMPSFIVPSLLFPTVFYIMFGIVMADKMGGARFDMSRHVLASYSTFGVMAPGLFGFGVALALERDGGLLDLKRALPMPPLAYLLAKMVMAMLVAGVVGILLLALAVLVAGVELDGSQILAVLATDMLGVLPFCAIGLWLGTLIKGQGAPAFVNLIFLPMAFLSGLWIPLQVLPDVMQKAAVIWPSYHLNQIALDAVGQAPAQVWFHALVLLGFTVVFLAWGAARLRRHG